MAAIKLYELSNVFTAGPVSSTIAEVFTPLQEDIYAVMNLTNERAPFFSLQKDIMCKQLPWTVAESSKPEHIEACKREFDYALRCPACLKGPIKWSK